MHAKCPSFMYNGYWIYVAKKDNDFQLISQHRDCVCVCANV